MSRGAAETPVVVGDIREERPELWIAFWAVVAVLFAAGFIVPRNRGTDG